MTNEETRQSIGTRIAELRKAAELTQTALAEKAGIQRTHLVRIEQGKYGITIDILNNLASVLGAHIELVQTHKPKKL